MYGDSSRIKRRTDQLREQAVELRALADRLVAQTEAVGWAGRAAEELNQRIGERAGTLRELAGRHQDAVEAMAAHRDAVDEAKERIAEAETAAGRAIEEARGRVAAIERENAGRAVPVAPDPADAALLAFTPPPRGDKAWLDVELPGR